jgi:hypothetical protein
MKKRSKYIAPERYVVVNQDGAVFAGLRGGKFQYSHDWSEAKPLDLSNTYYLMREKGNELIKESEL